MAISGVNPKCYILALFVRDDGKRFLLGDDPYEFKDNQLHFQQNTMANDVVEVQGNDGYLLAGQVRRPGTQVFDGYVCNGINSKDEVETKRRAFLQFFRRSHFYKVIYVFPNGTAIQRKQGFLVDDPTVQELYQQYPEYHVALNFEDVNYYTYEEDDQGHEIYAKEAIVPLARGGATGGLIWDEYGIVWEDPWSLPLSISGKQFQILNNAGAVAPIENAQIQGDTYQQTYSGKNLVPFPYEAGGNRNGITATVNSDGTVILNGQNNGNAHTSFRLYYDASTPLTLEAGTYYFIPPSNTGVGYSAYDGSHYYDFEASNGYTQTFSSAVNFRSLYIQVRKGDTTVFNNYKVYPMLSKLPDQTEADYEPYVGGVPAPNPDYPQAVQTVTGEQTVQVTGKNLFDINAPQQPNARCTATIDGGSITIISTVNSTGFYSIIIPNSAELFGKTVTLSFGSVVSNHSGKVNVYEAHQNQPRNVGGWYKGINSANIVSGGHETFTFPDSHTSGYDAFALVLYVGNRAASTVVGDYTTYTNVQIEAGSTATDYEVFKAQTHVIDLRGKNLLNIADFEMGGLYNGDPSPSTYRINNANHAIAVQPNTAYTLSAQLVSPVQGFRVGIHEIAKDGTFLRDLGWKQIGTAPVAMTTDSDTYYLKMVGSLSTTSTNVTTGGTENTTACDTVTEFMRGCTLQFEKGTTATAYVPFTQTELCRIGNYQDYIYRNGDDWYLHKEVRHLSLPVSGMNNTESFPGWVGITELIQDFPAGTNVNMNTLTDSWDNITGINLKESGRLVWGANNRGNGVIYANRNFFGNAWNQTYWTTNYPNLIIELYYGIVNTPTDTQITDATLVGQLEALGAMELFIGENNVLVGATDTNLPATLAFDYYTKFAAIGAEWEEGGTKGATIVDVDAIDNTYPVWELTGPATNPTLSVLTTNTTLTYNGTITASQKLVIDMFNKTATLNGTSVIGNISGDFVYMAPGTNRVTYTAGNTEAPDSTIYWQEVVG